MKEKKKTKYTNFILNFIQHPVLYSVFIYAFVELQQYWNLNVGTKKWTHILFWTDKLKKSNHVTKDWSVFSLFFFLLLFHSVQCGIMLLIIVFWEIKSVIFPDACSRTFFILCELLKGQDSARLPLTVFNYLPIKKTEVLRVRKPKRKKEEKKNRIWTWMLWLDKNHVVFGRTLECFLLEYQCLYDDDRWYWMCERPTHLMFTCWLTYPMQVCRMCLTVLYSWFLLEWG